MTRTARRLAASGSELQRWAPDTKVAQLGLKYQWMSSPRSPFDLKAAGFRNFSQFDEDGLLLAVFSLIGEGKRIFVEVGSADGINSNCANLAINHGWWGVFVDAEHRLVDQGKRFYSQHPDTKLYPPVFVAAEIGRDSINSVLENAGISGEIDLLSIDIDGNDYWVWDALTQVTPRVVIIETHVEFGMRNIVVPYDSSYRYPGSDPDYHGASPVAMAAMARNRGYRLVGANLYGFNTIWIRDEEGSDVLPPISPENLLVHPRNTERLLVPTSVLAKPFIQGGTGYPGVPAPDQVDSPSGAS